MREDYLWDKTGGDPEIERLEGLLAPFRYQETEVPAFSVADAVTIVEKAPRWRFRFAFAFAACAAVSISFGVWFQIANRTVDSDGDSTAMAPSLITSKSLDDSSPDRAAVPQPNLTESAIQIQTQDRISSRRIVKSDRRRKSTDGQYANQKHRVVLTTEEKYAYGQLMLALSITSSKLRLVRDTINQTEDGKSGVVTNDR